MKEIWSQGCTNWKYLNYKRTEVDNSLHSHLHVRVSPHWDGHLLAPVLLVEEQHIQDVLHGQAGVPPDVAVQHLLEVNDTPTLLGDPERGIFLFITFYSNGSSS